MADKKEMTFSMLLTKKMYYALKQLSVDESIKNDTVLSMADVMRNAIVKYYKLEE